MHWESGSSLSQIHSKAGRLFRWVLLPVQIWFLFFFFIIVLLTYLVKDESHHCFENKETGAQKYYRTWLLIQNWMNIRPGAVPPCTPKLADTLNSGISLENSAQGQVRRDKRPKSEWGWAKRRGWLTGGALDPLKLCGICRTKQHSYTRMGMAACASLTKVPFFLSHPFIWSQKFFDKTKLKCNLQLQKA